MSTRLPLSACSTRVEGLRSVRPSASRKLVASGQRRASSAGEMSAIGLGAPGLVDRSGTLRYGPNLPGVVDVASGRRAARRARTCRPPWTTTRHAPRGASTSEGRPEAATTRSRSRWAPGSVRASRSRASCCAARTGSPASRATWWSTRAGPLCPCGRRGCWERYASGSGLGRLAREAAHAGFAARGWSSWPEATPRTSGASTSPRPRPRVTSRRCRCSPDSPGGSRSGSPTS